jgi:LysR family transcriptional regulator, transcriptional activator of nhaA
LYKISSKKPQHQLQAMNFKHLHYFWVTAKAGGVVRAGEQLHTTPQTLSSQIKLLEERLGRKLFRKSGRNLALTDDGRLALRYADDIFALGGEMEAALREQRSEGGPGGPGGRSEQVLEFRVGVSDSMAKSVACKLLEPAMQMPQAVHLICREGKLPELLAQLALHRLDLVIADEPLPSQLSVKAFNHALGQSSMSFFCTTAVKRKLKGPFPQCLNGAPMLIQGEASPVRRQLDAWLMQNQLHPRIVAEFDDGALMKAFARDGHGLFMAASVLEDEICLQYGVKCMGRSDEMVESFFAISVQRRITHPAVVAITDAARGALFT